MINVKEQVEVIKSNEAAMEFCDILAVSVKIYGDASIIDDACWLSAELAKDDVDVSMIAVMVVAKELAA